VLVRLAYLAVSNAFAVLRLLPMNDRDKDIEILALRHQINVLQRQLGAARPDSNPRTEHCWQCSSRLCRAPRCGACG